MGIFKLAMGMATGKGKKVMTGKGINVLGHVVESMDGDEVALKDYSGKVLMIVNVASKCGMTPQYRQLVELHERYRDQGFDVLGFPANDFGKQEPGTNEEIETFCATKFGVEFEVFAKITLKGSDMPSLYEDLTSVEKNGDLGGEIVWNFTKFIVNRDGDVIARLEPPTKPDAPEAIEVIEAALGQD